MSQSTNSILMIRPVGFAYNPETAETNAFQQNDYKRDNAQERALKEFNQMVRMLRDHGIHVIIIEDTVDPPTPDSIFPNNWISTHRNKNVVLYPMQAVSRRFERRADIVNQLAELYVMEDIVDMTAYEKDNKFLEGTGSMVLDRERKLCYACLSPRTDKELVNEFCKKLEYTPVLFHAFDQNGIPVYHTNVIMSVGHDYLVICAESITDEVERNHVRTISGLPVIEISLEQMNNFAGNMLEVTGKNEEYYLVMSTRAYQSLLPNQITELEKHAAILHSPLETIEELGGGSARCMMAEIFLPLKSKA